MSDDWIGRFPALEGLEPGDRRALAARSAVVRVPAGAVVFGPGQPPENMLLLLSGTVRVHQTSETGREIVLYRVEAGQSCVLTTACLLGGDVYSAEGVAETETEAVTISRRVFEDLMARSEVFRHFVFASYGQRVADLLRVIDDVAFGRIDVRLAARLLALARGGDEIRATHQDLAAELGTAREVVSRQLQEFQRRGWIALGRGTIRLTSRPALQALAGA